MQYVVILKAVVDMLRLYSQILNAVAEIEEASGKKVDELLRELLSPGSLVELGKRLPPDIYGELMSSILRLAVIASTIQNPLALPASEKKRVAAEVTEIIKSLEKVVEKLKVLQK